MPGMMKKGMMYQAGGLVDRSEAKRRRETAANTVRSVDAMPTPRSRMARSMAETGLEDVADETRRLNRDNMERERMGGARKFQEGGAVRSRRRGPSYEEDMTPPRGMRGFRSNAEPSDEPMPGRRERRGFEEDMTPPRGMRGFNPQMVPTDEPPPGRPSRMKKGGKVMAKAPVKKKAGGVVKKAMGGMVGKGCK
jgi:hypothetical protein